MKKFLFKGFIFLSISVGIAYLLDYMIQEGLKTSNYREVTKWNEVIEGGIDAQILILGSSRALVHFDCEYIQKITGKTCYNLGFDGTTYPLQKLMLELYLSENKIPEKIIWSLDYNTFSEDPDFYGFEQLVPFRDNAFIRKMLSLHETPAYQFNIPIFRYSYNPKMKVIGLLSFGGGYKNEPVLKYGFRMQNKVWEMDFAALNLQNSKPINIDSNKDLFADFTQLNNSLMIEEIELLWVVTPYFEEYNILVNDRERILNMFSIAAEELSVTFYEYSNNDISDYRDNFYNSSHLSLTGLKLFMEDFKNILVSK